MVTYGDRLRSLREAKGLSQKELTDLLKLNRSTYARYETSSTQPDFDTLLRLSDFFEVSTDYILTGKVRGQLMIDFDSGNSKGIERSEFVRFPIRLKKSMDEKGITAKVLSKELNISEDNFNQIYLATALPFMPESDTLEKISSVLGVTTDYLLGYTGQYTTTKDEKDIAKRLKQFEVELENSDGLAFDGEPMSDEAKESLKESMELLFRQTQRINKKFTPKKYREDDE